MPGDDVVQAMHELKARIDNHSADIKIELTELRADLTKRIDEGGFSIRLLATELSKVKDDVNASFAKVHTQDKRLAILETKTERWDASIKVASSIIKWLGLPGTGALIYFVVQFAANR